MKKTIWKVVFSLAVRVGTSPFRLLPIRKKRILFAGLTGGNGYDYSCNPKYIYEYLKKQFPGQFEYVWAVSNPEQYRFLREEGVKVVKHFTVSSFPMLLTAGVIVTNGSYVPWFPFRKKQYVINTWHGGGAYKKVEMEIQKGDWAAKSMAKFCAHNMNLFLASCKVQEQQMIRQTYQYKGEVLRAGTPRNDNLFTGSIQQMEKMVRTHYQLSEDTRILLYAPTYRKAEIPVELNVNYLLQRLQEKGEKWVCFVRRHRYQTNDDNIRIVGSDFVNVAEYPDMQELLAAADVLVTDYSSSIWDYALLKRPCCLFVPDREEYIAKTGFYVEMERWPFPCANTTEELSDMILQLLDNVQKREAYNKRVCQHLVELGSYESGACCEAVAQKILDLQTDTKAYQ